jgi:N-sulfoglucosamine sulfohydrolase
LIPELPADKVALVLSPLSRRSFLQGCGVVAATGAAGGAQTRSSLPNFLFLISDDHSVPDLGCYGNAAVTTPNLDRLAAGGMRFTNSFVASPQCSPNRSAIFTGCTPHSTSTSRLHTPMAPWEPTFLEPLQERGYFTGALKKVHQGDRFNERLSFYDPKIENYDAFFDRVPKDSPFWLQVGFTDPHRAYKPGAFDPPHDPKRVKIPAFLPDTPEVRQDLAHYYDFIARMDKQSGEILGSLAKRGWEENTLVIFVGDNGMPFPRAKGTCYDPGIQVPMIGRWPGKIAAGAVSEALFSHVDLAPTWLAAAGLPVSERMQGVNQLDVLLGKATDRRTEVFSERNWHDNFDPIRSVRTKRHKLIFNAAPHFPYRPAWDLENSPTWREMVRLRQRGELSPDVAQLFRPSRPMLEFYDLEKDPHEFNNVESAPAYREQLGAMLNKLSAWMHETRDYLPPARPGPGEPAGREWPVSL